MKWFFFYDRNFIPLRDHMVNSVSPEDGFEPQEDFLEDLGVMKNRAGGGVPTYLYKAQKIRDALDAVEEGEVFLFTDVDLQFLGPVRAIVEEAVQGVDLVLQREFEDIGVNIGFIAVRNTPASRQFWEHVRSEIARTQALDQRVVNNTLYSGLAQREFGMQWGRFPVKVWCSSLSYSGDPPMDMVLHHANFTIERAIARDPSVKLGQLTSVRDAVRASDAEVLARFAGEARQDQSMIDYRDRHFGARRPGPEWSTLPEGHIARPGGFREKKGPKGGDAAKAGANTEPGAVVEGTLTGA